MKTTSLFVEALISGVQAVIWLILLLIAVFGHHWLLQVGDIVREWANLAVVIALLLCYPIGIIVDKFADGLFSVLRIATQPLCRRIQFIGRIVGWFIGRLLKMIKNDDREAFLVSVEKEFNFLRYLDHRMRIMRATAVNVLLITAMTLTVISTRADYIKPDLLAPAVVFVALIGLLISASAVFAFVVLEITYDERFRQARRAIVNAGTLTS